MTKFDENLPDAVEILQTAPNSSLGRRTFLLGSGALLSVPVFAEALLDQVQDSQLHALRSKPYLMPQLGQSAFIKSVAFSPDDKYVLTCGSPTASLWEAETGKEIRKYVGHSDNVGSVAFTHDSRYVLTGSDDTTTRLWETETGKEIRRFVGHTNSVYAAVLSSNGMYVLTGSRDNTARLWETATGKQLRIFEGHTNWVFSVAFSPDGKSVLTGSLDDTARLWNIVSGQARILTGHANQVQSVAFSPDGRYVLTGSTDKTARLWEAETGKQVRIFEGHSGPVNSIAFVPDGKSILTGSGDKTARLWETETGKQIRIFEGHALPIFSLTLNVHGTHMLTGSESMTCLWELKTGKQLRKFEGHSDGIWSTAYSPDSKHILTGNGDNTARLWETETGKQTRVLEGHTNFIASVAFSPTGKYALTGSGDKTARIWVTETGKQIRNFEGNPTMLSAVAYSPDGKYVLTGSADNPARLWEIATGHQIRTFEGHSRAIRSVVFSPDGKSALTGSEDGTARLWETATGQQIQKFEDNLKLIWSVAFSPDGNYVLTGGTGPNATAHLREIATGRLIQMFGERSNTTWSVAFSPDSKYVLTGNHDHAAYLWDTTTGKQIHKFEGHTARITSVAFSPDSRYVLTGSGDSTTRLWKTDTGKEICSLISFRDGSWAVADPEGRYDASNGGDVDGLCWVVRNQAIDLKQLKQRYYVPGLMARILQGKKLPEVAAFDNVPLYPKVSLPERMPDNGKVAITLTNQDGGIGKVQILVNGKEVQADARGPRPNPDAQKLTLSFDLAPYRSLLLPGRENRLEVVAYNKENWLASRGVECEIPVTTPKLSDPPRLYAIVGGINDYSAPELHLRFAAHDAEAFATALSLGAKRLFGVDKVEIVRLTGAPGTLLPTRANFSGAFADARKLRAQDLLVVYLAGHGVALGKGSDLYCYLTQEARAADSVTLSDLSVRQKTTITSEELTDWIKQCPAHEQVMILDTCAAGAAAIKLTEKRDVDGDQVRALDRLKDRTGFHILMGCAADRVSYEATRYGQGVLTYALLQGMKGAALGEGGQVDVSKLFQYAVDNVPRLAGEIGGIQSPTVCAPRADSFPVGRMEKEDQEKVPLEKTYPLILRPVLLDADALADTLELTSALRKRLNDLLAPETRGKADSAIVVYVDAEEMPGAITPSGTYTVLGDSVKVRLVLRQDKKTVETLTMEGKKTEIPALIARITETIARAAQKY